MKLTLRARLAVISAVVFGLLLAGVSVVSYGLLARWLDNDVTARLMALTDGLHGYLRFGTGTPTVDFDAADSAQASFIHEATHYYQLYDGGSGQILVQSPGLAPLGLLLTAGEVHGFVSRPVPFDVDTDFGRFRLSNSVGADSNGKPYLLQVAVPLTPMDATLARFRDLLLWRVPLALLAAVLASWWFSGLALAPLSRVAAAARAIDIRTIEQRIPVRGIRDELDDVVHAFNDTLARLEHAVGEMRQFSAALAHELRTPLTALRGEIELAMRRAGSDRDQQHRLASQIEEIDRLRRLIDHILTLARAEAGQIPLTFAPLDLGELAQSLVDQLEPLAQARAIDLQCQRDQGIVVIGDAGWLQRLMLNLLDNALKFTLPGGEVMLRVYREGGRARIDVRDTGVGLAPEDARQVFQRFFRADPARSPTAEGAGLGLSLVRWIVDAHHGTVVVGSRLGEGSTFTVTLPVPV